MPPPNDFLTVSMPMTTDQIFMLGIFCLAVVLYGFLCLPNHRPALLAIKPIVGSWVILLLILFMSYTLGVMAMLILSVIMLIKSLHEVMRLWRYSHKFPHKYNKTFGLDLILLLLVILCCVSFFGLYCQLATHGHQSVLLFVLFCIQINDVCQYVMGKLLGHRFFARKLAPKTSPNKTIEGVLFGIPLMAVFAVLLGNFLTPFSPMICFMVAVILGMLGVLGDLLESKVKRIHHIKDIGTWLKGHGGLLDRIDSLLFALPVFWMIYTVFLS